MPPKYFTGNAVDIFTQGQYIGKAQSISINLTREDRLIEQVNELTKERLEKFFACLRKELNLPEFITSAEINFKRVTEPMSFELLEKDLAEASV